MQIEIQAVTKQYGSTLALRDLSLSIKPGVLGLLGPDGAGKTTLMSILERSHVPQKVKSSGMASTSRVIRIACGTCSDTSPRTSVFIPT